MTYGMTKEQMISANSELIKAVQSKDERIRELEAELAEWKSVAIEKDDILDRVKDYPELKARVAELEASRREDTDRAGRFQARAEKAEAELRRDLAAVLAMAPSEDFPRLKAREHAQGCTGRHWCEVPTQEGFLMTEAREREEC